MDSQAESFWNEIACHQFCFDRGLICMHSNSRVRFDSSLARLECDIIKTVTRDDLIRFYDHYISPRSLLRRKLVVYVKPTSVALATAPVERDGNEKIPTLEEEDVEAPQNLKPSELLQRSASYEECQPLEPKSPDTVPDITQNRALVIPEVRSSSNVNKH